MQKTKKQHYVPQSYLKAWAIPGTYQVHVYDKKTDNERVNSINDIASENCFYDINPNEIFSKEFLAALKVEGLSWDSDELSQGIEHTFANEVEGDFANILKEIIGKATSATPWIIENCYFISEDKKGMLSAYLAIQYGGATLTRPMPGQACVFKAFRASLTLAPAGYRSNRENSMA